MVHIFGIRHHGPGSARSLLQSLAALQPDILLVEGPPEAEPLLPLASSPEMRPPVALLLYVPDDPKRAVFYPFAAFSPEWNAIQFAQAHNVPLRFMDLPQTYQLADNPEESKSPGPLDDTMRNDPLSFLAEAAGCSDSERWWEKMVEHRQTDSGIFAAILEAMTALRHELGAPSDIVELRREAFMRQTIRKAIQEGFTRIAVICGAWHGPALAEPGSRKDDAALTAGLPKVKIAATWIPWTHGRLAYRSGYGAGIESPGWYAHLWECSGDVALIWMTRVARLLREQDLDASPAHVIEAVRLAETLAAMRDHPLPGLKEMNESVQTVFSFGSNLPLRLIEEKLIVGDILGNVPPETPMVPLLWDIERKQKSLRIPAEPIARELDLDLRKDVDLNRSYLLHRLDLLGIPWGTPTRGGRVRGTFHELWRLLWRPEFSIAIIEASVWGNTLEDAAEGCVKSSAAATTRLSELSALLDKALLGELPQAVHFLTERLQTLSALTSDVAEMMDSLGPLVRIARYGNVRKTDTALVQHVVTELAARISIGLVNACASLDDDAAAAMYNRVKSVHESVGIMLDSEMSALWLSALNRLAEEANVHGLVSGRASRLLLDAGIKSKDETALTFGQALAMASDPIKASNWIEGFLSDSGQLLLLDDSLRTIVDEWVMSLSDDDFVTLLPLVRRTFTTFTAPERKQIGERIKDQRQSSTSDQADESGSFDPLRGDAALPLLLKLLGLPQLSAPS